MVLPLLAVDVGNSRIKLALFDRNDLRPGVSALPECLSDAVVTSPEQITTDRLRRWHPVCESGSVHGVIASTRAPWADHLRAVWPPEWNLATVANTPEFPLLVSVRQPRRVGVDRLLGALAASRVKDGDQPAIVVDSGTAITVDLVAEDDSFRGGAILPGVALGSRALFDYTDALPHVTVDGSGPPAALGRDTESALKSGLFWGHLGAVREVVYRISADLRSSSRAPKLLLTGGGASLLAPFLSSAQVFPHLVTQGLAIAWQTQTESA